MVNSVLNEGLKGMLNSQRDMQKSAQDIARANVRTQANDQTEQTNATATDQPTTLPPVNELQNEGRQSGLEESLIELRRQEQLFTANAKVVQVASDTLGSIIDVKS